MVPTERPVPTARLERRVPAAQSVPMELILRFKVGPVPRLLTAAAGRREPWVQAARRAPQEQPELMEVWVPTVPQVRTAMPVMMAPQASRVAWDQLVQAALPARPDRLVPTERPDQAARLELPALPVGLVELAESVGSG